MPSIPNITPTICVTRDQAVNMLLASIAMEEVSISRLMDAETEKILYAVKRHSCDNGDTGDLLAVNNSVNATVINLIKMQMLLQFKLENVERIIPPVHACPSQPCCGLVGRGEGFIKRECDEFDGAKVVLNAHVCADHAQNSLSYLTHKGDLSYGFEAHSCSLSVRCSKDDLSRRITISGEGSATKVSSCSQQLFGAADFSLIFTESPNEQRGFRLTTGSKCSAELSHDSGFISLCDDSCGLRIDCSSCGHP